LEFLNDVHMENHCTKGTFFSDTLIVTRVPI
jgi:hypothetical protein